MCANADNESGIITDISKALLLVWKFGNFLVAGYTFGVTWIVRQFIL